LATPFAPVIGNIQDDVNHPQLAQAKVAALREQAVFDPFEWLGCDFHSRI
jgi:hypothetical protein